MHFLATNLRNSLRRNKNNLTESQLKRECNSLCPLIRQRCPTLSTPSSSPPPTSLQMTCRPEWRLGSSERSPSIANAFCTTIGFPFQIPRAESSSVATGTEQSHRRWKQVSPNGTIAIPQDAKAKTSPFQRQFGSADGICLGEQSNTNSNAPLQSNPTTHYHQLDCGLHSGYRNSN